MNGNWNFTEQEEEEEVAEDAEALLQHGNT